MSKLHVVFGSSGGIGNAVTRDLARRGERVRGVNRSGSAIVPSGVELVAAEATSLDDVRRAVDGASVIYNCLFPTVQDAIIEAVAEIEATIVLASTLYMYDPTAGPMSETSPHSYGNREGGTFYAEVADQLLAAHQAGRVPGVVARASDIYGPNVRHGIGRDQVFGPVSEGKPANFLGDLDVLHTYTFADDCARALITLGEQPEALGQIWHLPSTEPIATRELLNMIFAELEIEPRIRVANGLLLSGLALFNSQMKQLKREKVYQFQVPWLVDHSKFEQAFGSHTTPHPDAVKRTVAWFKEHPEF
jgi:nucleoside-diphosphate-sugar epimerase